MMRSADMSLFDPPYWRGCKVLQYENLTPSVAEIFIGHAILIVERKDLMFQSFTAESKKVHELNKRWWKDPKTGEPIERNKGQVLMLAVSELAEALEGHRKNKADEHLPQYPSPAVELADCLIRLLDNATGFGFELNDDFIMDAYRSDLKIFSGRDFAESLFMITCSISMLYPWAVVGGDITKFQQTFQCCIASVIALGALNYQSTFIEAYYAKNEYNKTRLDHTDAHRLAEGGKKY